MICKSCKAEVADGAKFCAECGAPQHPVVVAPPPVTVAAPPKMEPSVVKAPELKNADVGSGETEEFWGRDPKYGKIPWGEIAFLAFAVIVAIWCTIAGIMATGALAGVAAGATLIRIIDRLFLKPTKIYYSLSPQGLSYISATGSMDPVAWSEMKRLERMDDSGQQLKLTWMGYRGNDSVFKWHDRLMTRLTGKVHKGGVPVDGNSTMERSLVLDGKLMSPKNFTFRERFETRFQQMTQTSDVIATGGQ